MMRGLVRHHGVVRSLLKPAAVAASLSTLGLNVLLVDRLRQGDSLGLDSNVLLQLVILLGGMVLLTMRETGLRASPWSSSLPVSVRVQWTAHLRALVVAVSLLVATMAVILVGLAFLLQSFEKTAFIEPGAVMLNFARPWLVLLAMVLMLGAWRGELADPGRARGWTRQRFVLALAAFAGLVVLSRLPLVVSLFPVLAASVLVRRQAGLLPPVFSLAERDGPPTVKEGARSVPGGRGMVHRLITRQLFKWPLSWIVAVPMVFLLGLAMGGFFTTSVDAEFARYFNVWITVYLLIAFCGHLLHNLYHVDHLPIPRELILRWMLLPGLAALLAGGLIGTAVDRARPQGETLVFANDSSVDHHGLLIPPDMWEPVWGTPPSQVTAPWGESRPVAAVAVIAGGPLHLWKPFTTVPEASIDFVAWQISRAAAAIHGVTVDPDTIRERYLVSGPDGAVQVRDAGLTLVADGLVPPREPVGPVLALLLGTTVVASLLVCWLVFRACGPGVSARRVKVVFAVAMGALLLLHLAGYALLMARVTADWMMTGLVEGAARRLAEMGSAAWTMTWLAFGLAAAAVWRLCVRAFDRVEAVRGGSCSLF